MDRAERRRRRAEISRAKGYAKDRGLVSLDAAQAAANDMPESHPAMQSGWHGGRKPPPPGYSADSCSVCGGSGKISRPSMNVNATITATCGHCHGFGYEPLTGA